MTALPPDFPGRTLQLFAAAERALAHVPPAFPLAATVAVNPFLGQAGEDRATAAARLARVAGIRPFRPRSEIAAMLAEGRIGMGDLAVAAAAAGLMPGDLRAALDGPAPAPAPLPSVADLACAATGIGWPDLVSERIGAFAAAWFDRGQAFWPAPEGGFYATWRSFARRDLTPEIAGLSGFCASVASLPEDRHAAFAVACGRLGVTPDTAELYLHRLLMSLGGWAQYARHLGWLAERDGGHDGTGFEVLTVRLAWDMLLLERHEGTIARGWAGALAEYAAPVAPDRDDRIDAALDEAVERAAERALCAGFADGAAPDRPDAAPAIQAAFCIDVRSEVLRRALEAADGGIETIGFAGFFGLPVRHRALGSELDEARAPVLLKPALETTAEATTQDDLAHRIGARGHRAWGRFKMAAVSAFAFVEAAGPLYVGKLLRDALPRQRGAAAEPAPMLDLPLPERVAAAARVLRAMSLTDRFAPLVVICGHGARVTNAPHASALQCGACGGHAGDVNARLLAGLLNDPGVRAGLGHEGIVIPMTTRVIAGLHDTVSDEVTLFEDGLDTVPGEAVARLRAALASAAALARTERAAHLPRARDAGALALRGGDWSEVRPEWGLAGCTAFIAAPRARSTGRDLGGRVFLHDYDWHADRGFATLELILSAPVVVASWISLQYNGSVLAPDLFGAGNKLLHNVTGGIGVVEGNGGPLRAGLPWQSVHDGAAPRHEVQRLKVVVAAPARAISAVLARHGELRALFDNGWLSLFTMDEAGRIAARYERGRWAPVPGEASAAEALSVA